MIIYYDGSDTVRFKDIKYVNFSKWQNRRIISWGIHVVDEGEITELTGHHVAVAGSQTSGIHEIVALVESIKFAVSRGVEPEDVTFYTDDEVAVFANQQAFAAPYQSSAHLNALGTILLKVKKLFYDASIMALVYEFIYRSRFVKVPAHRTTINNLRVDYLARRERDIVVGLKRKIRSYDLWLMQTFNYWERGEQRSFVPPFVRPELIEV